MRDLARAPITPEQRRRAQRNLAVWAHEVIDEDDERGAWFRDIGEALGLRVHEREP